ncbi:MAG: hypothetical protein ACXQTE_05190 [Methanosarcinaceae archaeon]
MGNAMLGQMVGMIGSMLPAPEPPKNPVAQFLADELVKLAPDNNDMIGMVSGVAVGMANEDPNNVLKTLVTLHNDIGALVARLQEEQDANSL